MKDELTRRRRRTRNQRRQDRAPFTPSKTGSRISPQVASSQLAAYSVAVATAQEALSVSIGSVATTVQRLTSTTRVVNSASKTTLREGLMELPESKMQYGHYSLGMQPDKIIVWARKAREELVALWGDKKYLPIFVYSGMSGISHATALSMEWHREMNTINFGMMYVRKAGEVSHGRHVQHTLSHMKVSEGQPIFVFVDDCIGGGHTRTRTVLRAKHFLAKIAIPGNHQSIIAVNRALHPELIYQILTYEVRSMKMPDEKDWKGLDVMKEIEQDRGSWC